MRDKGTASRLWTDSHKCKACATIGAIDKGKKVHDEISRLELLELFNFAAVAIQSRRKCGKLGMLCGIFCIILTPWYFLLREIKNIGGFQFHVRPPIKYICWQPDFSTLTCFGFIGSATTQVVACWRGTFIVR